MDRTTVTLAAAAVLAFTNLRCFLLMAHDKRCAQQGKWRVPEKKLFRAAACFGALGGVLAMRLLRHKTRHRNFAVGFPAMLAVQLLVLMAAAQHLP